MLLKCVCVNISIYFFCIILKLRISLVSYHRTFHQIFICMRYDKQIFCKQLRCLYLVMLQNFVHMIKLDEYEKLVLIIK